MGHFYLALGLKQHLQQQFYPHIIVLNILYIIYITKLYKIHLTFKLKSDFKP